jgi:hypothetical protein
MPNAAFDERCRGLLSELRETGQYKTLRHITAPVGPTVHVEGLGEETVSLLVDGLRRLGEEGPAPGVLALVVPGIAIAATGHVTDTVFAPPPSDYVDGDDTLYLCVDDAVYMNRVFSQTTHEVAYCCIITDNEARPRLEIWRPTPYALDPRRSSSSRVIVPTRPWRFSSIRTRTAYCGSPNRTDEPSNSAPEIHVRPGWAAQN